MKSSSMIKKKNIFFFKKIEFIFYIILLEHDLYISKNCLGATC